MPDLLVMGVSAATTDTKHENTHLLLRGEHSTILIDCPAKSLQRTLELGMSVDGITDMILTHFHPDHVGGFAGFMLDSWVLGRKNGLRAYGPHHCLKALGDMMIAFEWGDWPGFFPVTCTHLPMEENVPIVDNADFTITGMPMQHYVPTLGLRITAKKTGYTIAYSADTSPCENIVRLAEGVDLLIHEAAGIEPLGHSSAYQAGEVAASAGAKMLALIHYNVWHPPFDRLVNEAKESYDGKIILCTEGMAFPMGGDQG